MTTADDQVASQSPLRDLLKRFWYVPVLAAYAAMVGVAAMYHEPWMDEAQAWLIARDCDLGTLFSEALRYEGHPALWYLIVKAAIFLGLPYDGFPLFSAAIATIGVGVLLAKSPFPKWMAALWPFTYFLAYQYAVIARSYVLIPLLLFATAVAARDKWEKPIRWAVLLVLLANVSSHSFFIAGGIVFVHCVELLFRWSGMDVATKKRQVAAVAIYALGALCVVAMLWPAKDCTTATGMNGKIVLSQLWNRAIYAVDMAFFGCSAATIGLLLLSAYWFWKTRVFMLFLASCMPVFGIFLFLRVARHHDGILLLAWLFVLWCSMDAFQEIRRRGMVTQRLRWTSYAMALLVACLIVRQGIWTFQSVAMEISKPYCGAKALAEEIKTRGLTKYRLAMTNEWAVAVQPYFPKNIFMDFPNYRGLAYVDWHAASHPEEIGCSLGECLAEPCDILIWSEKGMRLPTLWTVPTLKLPQNWRYVGYFFGRAIYKDQLKYPLGFGMFATQHVADELNMPTVQYDAAISEKERASIVFLPEEEAVYVTQFYLDLGKLLRKIEPLSAIELFQLALDHASKVNEKCFFPNLLGGLQYLTASAHCGLAAALEPSDPKSAMEHLQTALELLPKDPNTHIDTVAALAQAGQVREATDELREILYHACSLILKDLSQEMAQKKK